LYEKKESLGEELFQSLPKNELLSEEIGNVFDLVLDVQAKMRITKILCWMMNICFQKQDNQ